MAGYVTGAGNLLLSDGTYDYTYDAEGNQITATDIATGAVTTNTWDDRNRQVGMTVHGCHGACDESGDVPYNALDQLICQDGGRL